MGSTRGSRAKARSCARSSRRPGSRSASPTSAPWSRRRVAEFLFDGAEYHQTEWFFAIAVERFEPHGAGWEPIEHQALLAYRWWTVAELEATTDVVYPNEMATVLRAVLAGPVTEPITLSGT